MERRHVKPVIRPVKLVTDYVPAAIDFNIKAAGHRNNDLSIPAIGMASPRFPAWNVIDPKSPLNQKRNVAATFYKGQVPSRVGDLRQFYDSTLIVIIPI